MATFAKQFSCFFLIALSIFCQIQARESKFFSKYVHLNTNNYVTIPSSTNLKKDVPSSPTPTQAPITSQISGVPASSPTPGFSPALAPAPAPISGAEFSPAPSENEMSYYDLNGKNTYEEEEEFSSENPEEVDNNREAYNYNNVDLSSNNGFWTSNHKSYYDNNNGYDFNGGYESEPQGMSDTRLVDNGRYYNNAEQENYGSNGIEDNNEEGYYFGGSYKKSKYEFDSMEEYEKQEGYSSVEQEFINP